MYSKRCKVLLYFDICSSSIKLWCDCNMGKKHHHLIHLFLFGHCLMFIGSLWTVRAYVLLSCGVRSGQSCLKKITNIFKHTVLLYLQLSSKHSLHSVLENRPVIIYMLKDPVERHLKLLNLHYLCSHTTCKFYS